MQNSSTRATFGQKWMGVQIVSDAYQHVGLGKLIIRYVVSLFSSIILKIGYLFAIFTSKSQTLHDLAAGTIVVVKVDEKQFSSQVEITTKNNTDFSNQSLHKSSTQKNSNFSMNEVQPTKKNESIKQSKDTFEKEQSLVPIANNSTTPKIQTQPSIANENDLWEMALNEFEGDERKKGLWAKLYAENDGDESKIKVMYLKTRVKELKDEAELKFELQRAAEIKDQEKLREVEFEKLKKLTVQECIEIDAFEIINHKGREYFKFPNGKTSLKRYNEIWVYENSEAIEKVLDNYAKTEIYSRDGFLEAIRINLTETEKKHLAQVEVLKSNGFTYLGYNVDSQGFNKWCFLWQGVKFYIDEDELLKISKKYSN
jgi:hypothetical protein